ncbi:hypothetical protein F5Y00DRAFT_234335 [Daldinia vernicosa]|uniref:uncharacterized protein n=1 Tax=Daldinia vernicosa TaxID=114800 RepID=UPI002008C82C|nr:uncharacterized protein F5Y00DRAFT_234335 [Daldinia vernicosa]KAI0849969.1 hypothetical protein F5Y00DRAFT_234335 [Daldinia vernicosa]
MTVSEVVHVTVTEMAEACHQTEIIVHETTPTVVHETIVVPPMVHTTSAAPLMIHTTSTAMHYVNTTSVAPPMVQTTVVVSKATGHMAPSSTSTSVLAVLLPASSLSLGYMVPHNARRWQA